MSTEDRNPSTVQIDLLSTSDALHLINREDEKASQAVQAAIPQIAQCVDLVSQRLAQGAKLIYVGAGTSGRLGALDAAELQPTFGIGPDVVQALMAGGTEAFGEAKEELEDEPQRGAADLRRRGFDQLDTVIGVSASGRTLYTLSAVRFAASRGALTVGITCNPDSDLSRAAAVAIELDTGPEAITGSTRMKAATAQKMALNMISAMIMIRLGRTYSNWMVHLQGKNRKLSRRAVEIVSQAASISVQQAESLLADANDVPVAILMARLSCTAAQARASLEKHGTLRKALGES